jgi:hypothetical protein
MNILGDVTSVIVLARLCLPRTRMSMLLRISLARRPEMYTVICRMNLICGKLVVSGNLKKENNVSRWARGGGGDS